MTLWHLVAIFCFCTNFVQNLFCSSRCAPNQCTGTTTTSCTGCDAPLQILGNTCVINPSSNYQFLADTAFISYNRGGSSTCGSYSYLGPLTASQVGVLRYLTPVTQPHYCVRLIVWVLMVDQWDPMDGVVITNRMTGQSVTQYYTSIDTQEKLCGVPGQYESYLKLDVQVPHANPDTVDLQIGVIDVFNNDWGIKQYYMLIGLCHSYCQKCTSSISTSCSECSTNYWLSGTTCDTQCLAGYTESATVGICAQCSPYCIQCYVTSINCSSCQTSGAYESFLDDTSCVTTCTGGKVAIIATHQCIFCSNPNCTSCSATNISDCSVCTPDTFIYQADCLVQCPESTYASGSTCLDCDSTCSICTGAPSPCSECTSGSFLHLSTCVATCPNDFFPHGSTRVCRDCSVYCVTATLTLQIAGSGDYLIATLTFSQQMDFSNFPTDSFFYIDCADPGLDMGRFRTQINIVNSNTLTLSLIPIAAGQFTDTTFNAKIYPSLTNYTSINGNYLDNIIYSLIDSVDWSITIPPQITEEEEKVIERLQKINDKINNGLSQKWVQEIKKTGIFSILLSGAQLSSTVVLCNTMPARNMYEGARFWATFIYFQVPKWEQDGQLHKYVVSKEYKQIVSDMPTRLLQATQDRGNLWRLTRTGHTSFFLIDTYIQCGLLVLCWLLVLGVRCYNVKATKKLGANKLSILYNVVHKVHEISLFYIGTSVALEAVTFWVKKSSLITYVSFGVSLFAILYFLIYHTYIFYRLIPFAKAEISSNRFNEFVERYSYFLRDLRFQEYPSLNQFTSRHLLRPYSYVVGGYIRLVLAVCCLPLFQEWDYGCIACLVMVQSLEVVRFFLTWPYHAFWRNCYRAVQELVLLFIFCLYLFLDFYVRGLYQDLNSVSTTQSRFYFTLGWVGFVSFFLYNILFIAYQIIDIVIGCRFTNWERVQFSRQQYYAERLAQIEEKQELLPGKGLLTGQEAKEEISCWRKCIMSVQGFHIEQASRQKGASRKQIQALIKKGNLGADNLGELASLRIMIEEFIIRTDKEDTYQVIMEKAPGVFMRPEIDARKKNNLLIPERSLKTFYVKKKDPITKGYFKFVEGLYLKTGHLTTEKITLKTYLKVDQNLYGPGQEIAQSRENISHSVLIKSMNGSEESYQIKTAMAGFPINIQQVMRVPRG